MNSVDTVAAERIGGTTRTASGGLTRILAFVTLCVVVAGLALVAHAAYRAMTDAFVAPMILSPDSDLVLENRKKTVDLEVDLARTSAQSEEARAELAAIEIAVGRLTELKQTVAHAILWKKDVHKVEASTNAADVRATQTQQSILATMIAAQTGTVEKARANLEAGIIGRTDLAREEQSLNQLKVAQLASERAKVHGEFALHKGRLEKRALAGRRMAPPPPDLVEHEGRMAQIELELLKLESRRQSITAELSILGDKRRKLEEIYKQIVSRNRPIIQAAERSLTMVFVPYSQIGDVHPGGTVLRCRWGWSLLGCGDVGVVTDVLSAEVVQPDPWGTMTRGQFAVVNLRDAEAAKVKVLRIREHRWP